MGPVGGRGFGGSVKFADGKTSSANVPHLNVWDFDISCCGNSAADISKPHTFKWDPLADEVLEAA